MNNPRLYLPNIKIQPLSSSRTRKMQLMPPSTDGDEGILRIVSLRKLAQFAFFIRDQARLVSNYQARVLLCRLGAFVGLVPSFTTDAADPLRALGPPVPYLLKSAGGNLTALFSRCGRTASQNTTETLFLPHLFYFILKLACFLLVSDPRQRERCQVILTRPS